MQQHTGTKLEEGPTQLRCIGCGALRQSAGRDFRCPDCGDLLEVIYPDWKSSKHGSALEPNILKNEWRQRRASHALADRSGVWRFRELLPNLGNLESVITLSEGNTSVYELPKCARIARMERLFAKHQGMNPTGSFKDTGMTVAATFARLAGFRWVACASTGNTSASMAAYAARGGMRSVVLIPEGQVSWGKLSQALDYGAVTCQLKTDFDGCMRVLNEVVQRMPVCLLNSVNPYRLEGQKTAAIELLEQFNWEAPDQIIVPGGHLGNSSALGKACLEMRELGLISRLPKISIIQAEGANPLVRAMRENGGKVEQVSEVEIALAKAEIGAGGIGCEPASAVTLAGLKKLVKQGFIKRNESVVLILTGHMLKDPDFTIKFHRGDLFPDKKDDAAILKEQQRAPIVLDASVEAVLKALEQA